MNFPNQWLKMFKIYRLAAKLFPFQSPPLLLLSYPRSGSSWIGEVLSHSPSIAYLREPINQSLLQKHQFHALIDPDRDQLIRRLFKKYGDLAFAGFPPPDIQDVIHHSADFHLFSRHEKQLLIKEVNPLASTFLIQRYNPTLILLLRHPAAIADSFQRMGWLDREWEKFGFDYGTRMKQPLQYITEQKGLIIRFEDFASHPTIFFKDLYANLGLDKPKDFDHMIRTYSNHQGDVDSPYQNQRVSKTEIEKWRRNLSPAQVKAVQQGYLRSGFPFYRGNDQWL